MVADFAPSPRQGEGWDGGRTVKITLFVFRPSYPHPSLPPKKEKGLKPAIPRSFNYLAPASYQAAIVARSSSVIWVKFANGMSFSTTER